MNSEPNRCHTRTKGSSRTSSNLDKFSGSGAVSWPVPQSTRVVSNLVTNNLPKGDTRKTTVRLAALTTGQKFDNLPPDSNIEALEVGH